MPLWHPRRQNPRHSAEVPPPACGGESDILWSYTTLRGETIDRSSERERAKAEERRRLAEALRANLKRRKAGRAGDKAGVEASKPEPPADFE